MSDLLQLRDEDIETTFHSANDMVLGDADGTDGDETDTGDGDDADGTDSGDGDDADGTDSGDGDDADGTDH